LLPQLAAVVVMAVAVVGGALVITAATRPGLVPWTGCGQLSAWVHSAYERHIADESFGGRPVRIDLTVHRLYCGHPDCPKATFAEQVPGLTHRYQRRTPALQEVVDAVALALAGSAGSRMLVVLHQVLSWMSVLDCLMRIALPARPVPEVIGIDEFATRKGQRYATIINAVTGARVDVLTDRTMPRSPSGCVPIPDRGSPAATGPPDTPRRSWTPAWGYGRSRTAGIYGTCAVRR
jgi:transposase